MMTDFHFLRPGWLFIILPLFFLIACVWRQKPQFAAWAAVCDKHLLEKLIQSKGQNKRHLALIILLCSALLMAFAMAGPAWKRLPVPAYHQVQPRVLVVDMSDAMLAKDLSPDRLSRAKFKLHDLLKRRDAGQFGLVVYTGEPFVVSPLTDAGQTIDALLSSLTPDIMPVSGHQLDTALEQAAKLIKQAGYKQGQILVLTGESPDSAAIDAAEILASKEIYTSIMPVVAGNVINPLFQQLATAGQGQVFALTDNSADLERWLQAKSGKERFSRSQQDDVPMWRDEGRWFLLPALLILLPVFRRGWLQRVNA